MKIEFFYPMDKIPTVTAQEKGVNFKNKAFYTKSAVLEVKRLYTVMLLKHRPKRCLEGAIALKVSFRFQKDKSHKEGEWKTSKPDTDNMLKLLKDVATECGYWTDDSQVCAELVTKKYSEDSGIYFYAEEIS